MHGVSGESGFVRPPDASKAKHLSLIHIYVRGIGIALCLLTLFIFLSGCGSLKDDTLLTVNAVITEVDTGKQTITVKDLSLIHI